MRRYVALARLPNGLRLLVGSVLIAPGQAAVDLVILLALHHATGSFGPGGIGVAAGTIAYSVSMIVQGRLVDPTGIRRVLRPAALALAAATAALAASMAQAQHDLTGCRLRARINNRQGVDNQEQNAPVIVCIGDRRPWSALWPSLTHYD